MSMRHPTRHEPASGGRSGDGARILYVDGDAQRSARIRHLIEDAGFPEAEHAVSGDEALDLLGAAAQQFELVVAWMPLKDGDADLPGVLRRCASPVRLVALTTLTPRTFPLAGRLAGVAAVDGQHGEGTLIASFDAVLASPFSVARA